MAQVPDIDVSTVSVGGSAYTVPFVYQNRAEVFVEVDGVSTTFTWINDGNISITPAPAAGAVVRRYRSTSALEIRHDYRNGVPFTPKNIAENNDQILYVVQEAVNTSKAATVTADGVEALALSAIATATQAYDKAVDAEATANAISGAVDTANANAAAAAVLAQDAIDIAETAAGTGVSSFNTRTGAVVPMADDYAIADIAGLSTALADKQAVSATLSALAGVTTGVDALPYFTGVDTATMTTLTAFMRTLLDDANATTARTTLGAAPLASPALTGTPTAPTAAAGTNTTQIATTAFVTGATANSGVGVGQYWQDVMAFRAANINYTNSTGKPIEVAVSIQSSGSGSSLGRLVVGGWFVGDHYTSGLGGTSVTTLLSAIVPNGATYSIVELSGATIRLWLELRG